MRFFGMSGINAAGISHPWRMAHLGHRTLIRLWLWLWLWLWPVAVACSLSPVTGGRWPVVVVVVVVG
jgi:hypothetical protein